jgi:sporulation protein YlmC with PRC-barrel domain
MRQLTHIAIEATGRKSPRCRSLWRAGLVAALALTGGCLVPGVPVFAADQSNPANGASAKPMPGPSPSTAPSQPAIEASSIISGDVQDASGDQIGKIEDLLIDPNSGRLTAAVVGLTDFFGVRTRKVVIPVQDLKFLGHREIATTLDKRTLLSEAAAGK